MDDKYVTFKDLGDKLDSNYDALDSKIQRVDDKLDTQGKDISSLKVWIKLWPAVAVAIGTVAGDQIAQALIR